MANKQTVVITGCGGMLGEAVYRRFSAHWKVHASDIDLNEPWLEYVDVTKADEVARHIAAVAPDAIVHLAAETDMEFCQANPDRARAVNATGVAYVVAGAERLDVPLVYISTAGIFDGKQEEYREDDQPNPLSTYGLTKYEGERIARAYPKSIVVRAGWMMGGGPAKDKKFVHKIIRQLRAGATELSVVSDKFGTPCYTYDLAAALEYLLERKLYGVYHGACDGRANRLEVAQAMVDTLGLSGRVAVNEVDSAYFATEYFAPRPASERLVNNLLKRHNPALTRDWRVCLSEYLGRFDWGVRP